MVEAEKLEGLEFKWGVMKKKGGKKKDVQFYGSFTYDGVEYFLYDSVYLFGEGEPDPHIGKLIKMWEGSDKKKKVKVLWFFRPREISRFLKMEEASENELLLASGEGRGLFNINPLEAISGKCNVVCVSKDSRNPQPTNEELQMADYIFCRTLDVGTCKVMDKIDDEIAGIDVKLLLNKMDNKKDAGTQKVGSERKENSYPSKKTASGLCITSANLANANEIKENVSHRKACLVGSEEKVKNASVELDDRPSKKSKLNFEYVDGSKSSMGPPRSTFDTSCKEAALPGVSPDDGKYKSKHCKDSSGTEKSISKKLKSDCETVVLSNGMLLKAPADQSHNDDCKSDGQGLEVVPRPDTNRRKWFKGLPWDDQMRNAYEQGTLVLLQNLDPSYTKEEVKDIVWHGFKANCEAKMIQRRMISSPYSGQAFVIFKQKDIAERVVKKLDEGCLLLSNGRPLVGRLGTPCFPEGKRTLFYGHIAIDKLRYQMPREQRDAVSTSHCSQPNTYEYDMAMEWILLHERSDFLWKKLFWEQEQEMRKLKKKLKAGNKLML
ncbi:protein ANTI-SILENCING 1 isoform X2 [Cannabis sativa]|uniref:protein ANTI-SILENCING 1 isoform X2 n=1 Tax=Cannabis sativa TaxID=3483 RepID=UPI0029CA11F7|nr:protein ANTI-SILENCING 1 isoform X2 [Cannabis sativa]